MGGAAGALDGSKAARVLLLGSIRLIDPRADEPTKPTAGQRRLLAALAIGDEIVRSDWLGEALGLAPSALRTAISRLRGRVHDGIVVTEGDGYRLVADSDADDFLRLVDGVGHGAVRVDALEQALALWSGQALAEVAHEPWAEADAARFNELRLVASEERAALLIALGRSSAAIPNLETLVVANPLRDRPRGLLMQALAIDGREVDALRSFQTHRRNLIEEAGVEPSLALRAIEERIAAGGSDELRVVADALSRTRRWRPETAPSPLRSMATSLRSRDDRRTNLDEVRTVLLGRDAELDEVRRMIGESQLVTITGPGGIGKTRVAREVGRLELDRMKSGVWFVDLTSAVGARQVLTCIAEVLQFPMAGVDAETRIVEFLAGQDALIILDNCEHVVDDVARFLETLLARPGRCRVVATSREVLDVEGGGLVRLSALPSERRSGPAVELFVERATSSNPAFDTSGDSLESIAELCRRLDGLPLAIELAAARSNVLTPKELLDGLDTRFELLVASGRRRSGLLLYDTMTWSYDLLEPLERRVFRALGAFAGPFDIGGVGRVAAIDRSAALVVMESLIAKSLVVSSATASGVRLSLFESIAAYARQQLEATGEVHEVSTRHCEHYVDLCAPFVDLWVTKVGDTELRADTDDLRAAAAWAGENGRWGDMAHLLRGSWHVLVNDPADFDERAVDCLDHIEPNSESEAAISFARMTVAIETDDGATLAAVLPSVAASTVSKAQALLAATRAVMIARRDPDGALREVANVSARFDIADSGGGDDEVRIVLIYAAVAAHNGRADYERVVQASQALDEVIGRVGGASTFHAAALAAKAIAHLAMGDRSAALDTRSRLETIGSGWVAADELGIVMHLDAGDVASAMVALQPYCHDAVSGRFTRQATAAAIYLGYLAYAENDVGRAIRLVEGIEGVEIMTVRFI